MTLGVMGIGEQGRCGISCVQSSYNWLHSIGSITGFIGLLGSWNYWSHGILFMVDVVNVRSCFRHVLLNSDWGGCVKISYLDAAIVIRLLMLGSCQLGGSGLEVYYDCKG